MRAPFFYPIVTNMYPNRYTLKRVWKQNTKIYLTGPQLGAVGPTDNGVLLQGKWRSVKLLPQPPDKPLAKQLKNKGWNQRKVLREISKFLYSVFLLSFESSQPPREELLAENQDVVTEEKKKSSGLIISKCNAPQV